MKLKVKPVKPIKEILYKFYLQVITDVYVKTAFLEICSETLKIKWQLQFTSDT